MRIDLVLSGPQVQVLLPRRLPSRLRVSPNEVGFLGFSPSGEQYLLGVGELMHVDKLVHKAPRDPQVFQVVAAELLINQTSMSTGPPLCFWPSRHHGFAVILDRGQLPHILDRQIGFFMCNDQPGREAEVP